MCFTVYISQDSVETHLQCGEIYNKDIILREKIRNRSI